MSNEKDHKAALKEANITLGAGASLGAYAGWTLSAGAVCPVCVVAAPTLIGMGLYARHKTKKNINIEKEDTKK